MIARTALPIALPILACLLAIAAAVAVSLIRGLNRPRTLNAPSGAPAPAQSAQRDFDNRKSWALEYFQHNPSADPLQMIGDYNAAALGKRLGYFSLDEARAIATEARR